MSPSPSATAGYRPQTDPLAGLPRLRLAAPPGPRVFVGMANRRIAVFSAEAGTRLRYLSSRGAAEPVDVVGSGASARVWYLRPRGNRTSGCLGAYVGYSVSINGGRSRREFAGHPITAFAADPGSDSVATVETTCPSHQTQNMVVIHRRPGRPTSRIQLPLNAEVTGLDLRGDKLSFFVQSYLSDTSHLYGVNVENLESGEHALDATTETPGPGAGCRWAAAAWSRQGLLAARQCITHLDNMGPTAVFLLDPVTLHPRQRGPTVAHGLGIASLSSDALGHLLVWHSARGGYVEGITSWSSNGRHVISTGSECENTEHPAGTTRCPSYPTW